MRISHQYRYVFLAYPRTASKSIQTLLKSTSEVSSQHISKTGQMRPFYIHMPARELKPFFERYGWDWDSYRRFCFVRNPFSRLVSLFHRRIEDKKFWYGHNPFLSNIMSLVIRALPRKSAFSLYMLTRNPQRGVARNFMSFIGDRNQTILVSDILRFENLSNELVSFLKEIGISILPEQIPHMNRSRSETHYSTYYNWFSKKRVEKIYAYEINHFGYRFD